MRRNQTGIFRKQWALFTLMALLILVFILQLIFGPEADIAFMTVPADVVAGWEHLREGQFSATDLKSFGTLLSYSLLHADIEHLAFNALILWIFAAIVKDLLGHGWMLGIFAFTAFTGGLCHVIFNPQSPIPMLGASGAVMGFEGAYLGMVVRWSLPEPHIWPLARPVPPMHLAIVAVLAALVDWTAIMEYSQDNTAFGAHLGGFVGGIFLTSFIARMPPTAQRRM